MTTATEHHDAQLAAIKARHEHIAQQLADPAVTVIEEGIVDFAMIYQVGLMSVYLDPIGRFWTVTVGGDPRHITARMVFDPYSLSRAVDRHEGLVEALTVQEVTGPVAPLKPWWRSESDPDDTQAAQGFKAHEG